MGIKFRLIAMNFLQYAIWGSWLISLGAYLGGGLDFSGLQIGSFFATMGIASLFMPAVMGIIADRWIPAQKILSAGILLTLRSISCRNLKNALPLRPSAYRKALCKGKAVGRACPAPTALS